MSTNKKGKVELACERTVHTIQLARLLPVKSLAPAVKKTTKYLCIKSSIKELGLIEPLVVYPQKDADGAFIILDGHIRFAILKELSVGSAKCLISTDDESFTFNHKVNRLSAIQEHFMITKAIKNGVSEERIARALNVDPSAIRQKRDLLEGICPEAVQILRDKRVSGPALRELRKVNALRQIEISELMAVANNYTVGYMKCLVTATPDEQRTESFRDQSGEVMSPEEIAKIEHESKLLVRELKGIEDAHGKNMLNLVIVTGYLKKLLDNARIVRFLSAHYADILAEFQRLIDAASQQDTESGPV